MTDINRSRKTAMEGVAGLSEEQLEEEIQLMDNMSPRKIGLFAYIGELFHHKG